MRLNSRIISSCVEGISRLSSRWHSGMAEDSTLARWLEGHRQAIISRWYDSNFQPQRLVQYSIEGVQDLSRNEMERAFLGPLLDLLVEYFHTGEEVYRDLYLDERLRYAPHRANPEVRYRYFKELLQEDEAILLAYAGEGSEVVEKIRIKLREIHAPLLTEVNSHPLRLLAVGDCLMNEVRVFLPSRCRAIGIALDMRCLYFSALMGKRLSTDQVVRFLESTPVDVVALSFLTYEGLPLYRALILEASTLSAQEIDERVSSLLNVMRGFIETLRTHTDSPIFLHNASGLPLTRWRKRIGFMAPFSSSQCAILSELNNAIGQLAIHTPNCILIDEANVAREHGYRKCQQSVVPRHVAMDAMFHTSRLGAYLCPSYTDILRSYYVLRRTKVLLVDFDNTLWDGVMADGSVHHHTERQQLLRTLKESGILLVALSKNDPKNIRWSEMVLAPEDFVLLKISWKPKVSSIQEVAAELDLGLDSFVLVDDSPEEREFVRSQLPKVTTFDSQAASTWRSLERLLQFPNTKQTEEARSRTELYRAQSQRRESLSNQLDYPAMMATLNLLARFGRAQLEDLDRITELVQRTNQFNTTTIRYPKAKLESLIQSANHRVYVAELSDKFGTLGLVAVVIVERKNDSVVIESFVMSCRAMGFGLEHLVLNCILEEERWSRRFVGRLIPTDRNGPAMCLFSECGFKPLGSYEWVLEGSTQVVPPPKWFTVVYRELR